jgi:hypothetical protein
MNENIVRKPTAQGLEHLKEFFIERISKWMIL